MLLHMISLFVGMIVVTILVVSVIAVVQYVRDVRNFDKLVEDKVPATYGLLGTLGTIVSMIGTIVFMSGPLGYFGIGGSIARAVELLFGSLIITALVFIILRVRHIQHAAYDVDTTEAKNQVIFAGIVLVLAAVALFGVTKITPEPLSEVPQPVPTQVVANPTAIATPTNTSTPLPPTLAPTRTPFIPPTWTPSPPSILPAECNKVTRLGSNLTDLEKEGWTGWACGSYVLFVDDKGHEWCKLLPGKVCVFRAVTMENIEGRPRFKSNEVPTSTPLPTKTPANTPTVVPEITPQAGCIMIEPLSSFRSPLEQKGWRGWSCDKKMVTITNPQGYVVAQLRQNEMQLFEGGIVCNKYGFPLFEQGAELQLCK